MKSNKDHLKGICTFVLETTIYNISKENLDECHEHRVNSLED